MNLVSLILLFFLTILISSFFQPKGLVMRTILLFLFSNFIIIETGYILSTWGKFSNLNYWTLSFSIFTLISLIICYKLKINIFKQLIYRFNLLTSLLLIDKIIIIVLFLTLVIILVLNLNVILFASPHNMDALTYHLARVAYFLQHGKMDWYAANQWPQVVHPKNSSSLFGFLFLASNFEENFTQLPQFFSYIILIICVFGISIELQLKKNIALISALITCLPICLVLGSTTNQNDLLITAFAACSVYFILYYKNNKHWKYLILFTISTALMTGFKASAIMIFPVLALTVSYAFYENLFAYKFKDFLLLISFCLIGILVLVLPSGYLDNLLRYGNSIGPEFMRNEHSFRGLSITSLFYEGLKNSFRYLANFCCFDGFLDGPNIIYGANSMLWKWITWIFENFWPDIYTNIHMRLPFGNFKKINADEEKVFFGPIGFLLVWPVVGWGFFSGIFQFKKSKAARLIFFLSFCCIIFLFTQSISGQFDPWRGRMFGTLMIFAAPLCGIWWSQNHRNTLTKILFLIVIVFSSWAAIWSILFRYESSWIKPNYTGKTLFKMNRMEQVMRDLPYDYETYRKFDEIVPSDAKVDSWLMGSYPEYVLFGRGLTRKIYTKEESLKNGIKSDYLIFDSTQFAVKSLDISLGNGLHLRKLD